MKVCLKMFVFTKTWFVKQITALQWKNFCTLLEPKSLHILYISHAVGYLYSLVEQDRMFLGLFKINCNFFTFILCNFFVRTFNIFKTISLFFGPLKHEKTLKSCLWSEPNFFFRIANQPKTSPNLNFFSIKIAHRAIYVYWLWLEPLFLCSLYYKYELEAELQTS